MGKARGKSSKDARATARKPKAGLGPVGYRDLLEDLKTRIRTAQVRAALSVNRELIALYWQIGQAIVTRQQAEGWGRSVVERLSADIQREFPGVAGFSRANIYRMRAFYLQYARTPANVSQPARQLDLDGPPEPMASLPWFHNVVLLEQVQDPAQRLWYARQTITNGWSRAVLTHWIESDPLRTAGQCGHQLPGRAARPAV